MFREEIGRLTQLHRPDLMRAAKRFFRRGGKYDDPGSLVDEAVTKVLSGERKTWDRQPETFRRFMYGVIRSLAGVGHARPGKQKPEDPIEFFERLFPTENGETTPFDHFMYGQAIARAQVASGYPGKLRESFEQRLGMTVRQSKKQPAKIRRTAQTIAKLYGVGFTMRTGREAGAVIIALPGQLELCARELEKALPIMTNFGPFDGRGPLLAGFLEQVRAKARTYYYPEVAALLRTWGAKTQETALRQWHCRYRKAHSGRASTGA